MESQQSISRPAAHRGLRLDRYYYAPDYTPPQEVSSIIDENHIIRGRRQARPPPRISKGEADIPILDEYKQRQKRDRSNALVANERERNTISVIIPSSDFQLESDTSSLTDLEDLADTLSEPAPDKPTEDEDPDVEPKAHEPYIQSHKGNTIHYELPDVGDCVACAGKIINLRQQTQLLLFSRTPDMEVLEVENARLKAEIARLRAAQAASSTNIASQNQASQDQLRDSQNEVKRLRRRLSSAQEFSELIRPLPFRDDAVVASTGFIYKEMDILNDHIAYTADLFCNIQKDTRSPPVVAQDLTKLISSTLASTDLLSSDSVSAFRALVFGFIRDSVFLDTAIWRDLHFDGTMLRQYQQIVERSISPSALERYHRAAVQLTLAQSAEFKEIFIPGYTEQLQFELLRLIAPFIRISNVDRHVKRQLHTLLGHALNLRAKCYPHKGTRYQLVQFAPGHVYDPLYMRAENNLGVTVPVPKDGHVRRIKVCVHGLIKAHSMQETSSGVDLIHDLSQPFLLQSEAGGELVSDKAVVILE
ncbi:hypothetical protein BDV12DRAFT_7609 [Aspergillus spectabilis]